MTKKKILVVTGPTASGKTALGVALAQALDGEVVSADSMQIYRGMDIGTAKPTQEEQQGIKHHMLDVASPEERYSVANYVHQASLAIEEIFSRGKLPLVVGGTGLYIEALMRGAEFAPFQNQELRQELEEELEKHGGEAMLQRLKELDPETGNRLFPNDHKRLVRGLEIVLSTGKTKSQFDLESKIVEPAYDACYIGLNFTDREDLRQRIYQRVDEMLEQGLMAEVEKFSHLPEDCTAMQAIAYKELRGVLLGTQTLEEGVELLKIRSRQYAKRQITWFRNRAKLNWYLWEKIPNILDARQVSTEIWSRFQVE